MMAAEGNLDDGCRCRFSVACLDGFAKESWMDEGEEKRNIIKPEFQRTHVGRVVVASPATL
jgi:hypothetical protein